MRYDLDYYLVDRMRDQLERLSESHESVKTNIDSRRIQEVFDRFNEHYHQRIQDIDESIKEQLLNGVSFTQVSLESRLLTYLYKANTKQLKNIRRRVEEIFDYDQLKITGDFIESFDDMAEQVIEEAFQVLEDITETIDKAHKVIINQEKIDLEVLPEI
ncbi:MAG: hypothetical protein Q3959_05735 [Limosilactobacillus sp.]|uniref:hypothetical protein n=1 Tax=Limosilactobacillus sp. TaxID=2773925 RepID=UPI00270BB401|nr:hypothetical protein [Limosilactobacillus sp.]